MKINDKSDQRSLKKHLIYRDVTCRELLELVSAKKYNMAKVALIPDNKHSIKL